MKRDCQIDRDELVAILKIEEILKKKLEREHEIINKYNESRNVATNIIKVQR